MEERRETNPRVNFLINIAYWAVIVAIIFLVFKYLINIMMPIFLAFIFAAVVRPISRALSRETRYVRGKDGNKVLVKRKFHMNRNVAGIISVLVLFIVVGGLLTLIVVRLTDTIVDFVSFAPTFYEQSVLPGITKLYNWVLEVGERFDVSIMDAIEQALPGFESIARRDLCWTLTLDTPQKIDELFKMTPYYYKTSPADQAKVAALPSLSTELAFAVLADRRL